MLKQFFLSPSVSDQKYQTLAMLRNSNNTPYLHKYEGFSIIQHPRRRHLYFCVRIRVLGFFLSITHSLAFLFSFLTFVTVSPRLCRPPRSEIEKNINLFRNGMPVLGRSVEAVNPPCVYILMNIIERLINEYICQ